MSEPRRHGRPRRKRSKARVALLVALGLVVVLTGGAFATVAYLQGRLDAGIDRIADPFEQLTDRPTKESQDGAPVNVLVLGSDSRISAGDPDQWSAGAQRTDAIMLGQVSGDRQSATLMSIPRDSWVEVPGHGMAKINAAFSYGGPALMIQTVEQLTGVRIDHFAVADFESFSALTDELGGVEITLTQPLEASGRTLPPGTHLLDGEQALQYARERYNVEGGDFGRVQRQQSWMRAIMAAAFDREVLTNPTRLMSFLETVTESVAVDEGFTIGEMRDLALSSRELRPGSVTFITAPYTGTGRSPDGRQSIVLLDEARFAEVTRAFAEDRVSAYLAENPDVAPRLGASVS